MISAFSRSSLCKAWALAAGVLLTACAHAQKLTPAAETSRQVTSLDANWRFHTGDAAGAEQPGYDDHAWSAVDVPHDWSIAGPVAESNPTGAAGGFFPNGIGWYRRTFTLPRTRSPRQDYVVFDGVMANSDVWINGFHLGHRPNGYVSFLYAMTGHLHRGDGVANVLAVRCDNSLQPASRWYEGAGIYRDVRLVSTAELHFDPWSVFLTTPSITGSAATVHVAATLHNEAARATTGRIAVTLFAPDGSVAARTTGASVPMAPSSSRDAAVDLTVPAPQRWTLEQPRLYRAVVSLQTGQQTIDQQTVPFGIREFHFDPDKGFFLNGKNFKLYGAALHIDGGAVGIAVPDAIYRQRLLALKAMGVNAIRTAHGPVSPAFLDLCDQLGLVVMSELFDVWTVGKEPYDYHLYFKDWAIRDLTDTVRRDRNHPSIILWSAGNEIHDTPHPDIAKPILASLIAAFHANDPTRPVTQALFRPNVSHDYTDGLADMLDVVGQNYRTNELLAAHAARPSRKIIGTENTHDRNQWLDFRDNPAFSGEFLWSGIDYLGEAGRWPLIGAGFGLYDRTLEPRVHGLERESWWSPQPVVHMVRRLAPAELAAKDPGYEKTPPLFPVTAVADWTPADQAPHVETVDVYSNGEETELMLNGHSLGRQALHADASPLVWQVPYAPGTLRAVTYRGGKPVATEELRTAGPPERIVLHALKPSVSSAWTDLVPVEAIVEDAHGVRVPHSAAVLHFSVGGAGRLIDTDSGSLTDHVPFPSPDREALRGRAVVYVRASSNSGAITVSAAAKDLTAASTTLTATPPAPAFYPQSF